MGKPPQYRAALSETALPEILATIHRHKVAGVVEASRDEVVKRIFVREGEVEFATSSDRNDSLGAYLRRTGRLTVEDARRVMGLRDGSKKKFGELLVEGGLLSPGEIFQAVREQVEAVVWSLFSWTEGDVSFAIGEIAEAGMIRIGLPMKQVIFQGILRAPASHAKTLASRLGGRDRVFEPCFDLSDLIEVALDHDQTRLLRLVDGVRTVYEICSTGPGSTLESARTMYGFQVLGLIRSNVESPRPERSTGKFKFKTGRSRTGPD